MPLRLLICIRIAATVACACLTLATAPARAQDSPAPGLSEETFQKIVACLASGHEIVMASKFDCKPYGKGDNFATNMPPAIREGNWEDICKRLDDPRRLPPDIVKRVAAQKDAAVAPTGIRIIGAVYCYGIDLVGVDLPYSLVLDRSVVKGNFNGRNLRIKGDFSFENAVILNELTLNRAHIGGSVLARWSYVDKLQASDTQVDGTWWQTDSIVFSDAPFHRVSIAGDLRLDNSAFTRLGVFSSSIGGTLNLNNTEARCAYHVIASTMNYFTAAEAGFGRVQTAWPAGRPAVDYPWWDRALSATAKAYTRQLFESQAIRKIAGAEQAEVTKAQPDPRTAGKLQQPGPGVLRGCEETSRSAYLEFYLFDSNVRSSACIASFAWLAPKSASPDASQPVSIVALNGTRVGGNLVVDLGSAPPSDAPTVRPAASDQRRLASKRKFEAIGVSAGALIYNFSDDEQPYFTYIDGLNFDRIHNASPACAGDTGVQLATQVELPSVDAVMHWLGKNAAQSSQPFKAFATAFDRAGESATELRVQRQTYDLCEKTRRLFPFAGGLCPRYQQPDDPPPDVSLALADARQDGAAGGISAAPEAGPLAAIAGFVSAIGDLVMISFDWGLYALADHGMRPGKVVWWVLITLVVFAAAFWSWLGIIGFEPKSSDQPAGATPDIWPVSVLFLFDRLIPIYKVREEHYAISKFYRWRPGPAAPAPAGAAGGPPYPMSFFGLKFLVWPATEADRRRAEKWLVVLRVIGVIFTIFLLAAINTLVR